MKLPTREECIEILERNIPDNIIAHSQRVCEVALNLVNLLEKKGIKVNKKLVESAALLHDVKKLSKADHVVSGFNYLKSLGYPEVAEVIKKHGLAHIRDDEFFPKTIEEKIVFYADKRVKHDQIVSIDERFADIRKRYNRPEVEEEFRISKEIEKELSGMEIEFS